MDKPEKTVLVTGGAGYVGSHVSKALSQAGYLPVTYDNLSRGHSELVKWGPLEVGDLLDKEQLDQCFIKYQPVAVMHFAGLIAVGESVEQPELYQLNNVTGSLNLLAAMKDAAIRTLIFSSTAALYGKPEYTPLDENHRLSPENPYGQTKLDIELAIEKEGKLDPSFRYANLRYFNAAGADPQNETGELHEPETHLIPLALQAVAGETGGLTIYGTDYPTPDGTCIRDYIHVSDLAHAHVSALAYLLGNGPSICLNLGTGTGSSVLQVIHAIKRVTGRAVPHQFGDRRSGDTAILVAAPDLARKTLDWAPRYTDLDDMIRTAWAWFNLSKQQ